jgi:hypothetical protein
MSAQWSGQATGGTYQWLDRSDAIEPDAVYTLEIVGLDGSVQRFDLGRAQTQTRTHLFLPVVSR